jgi:plastocyanin
MSAAWRDSQVSRAFSADCYGCHMRPLVLAVPVALLSLVTGCASTSPQVDEPAPSATAQAPAPAPAPAPTTEASAPETSAPAAGGAGGGELTGALGANDAFVITLVDAAGKPVTTIKAGKYTVKVKDTSTIHNFHLTGAGVEQTTTVPEVKDVTWTVDLKAGTYTYQCDPHPFNMKKTFTVS